MNRRHFVKFVSALALWHRASPSIPKPVIKKYDDGYTIDLGIVRCLTEKDRNGTTLVFSVFLTTYPMPGVVNEDLMVPTATLKKRLEAVGFPVVWEIWHPDFPFLVARMNPCPSPQHIAARLQHVLAGCDLKLLYKNPGSRR